MDMATECRVAKAQLSDDPDDWCWIRLYRCRPGAKVRKGLSWGVNPIWEDARNIEVDGPQIFLFPSQNRPWTLSPHPGLDYVGRPEWYERGLPLDVRIDEPAGLVCGGDLWDCDVDVGADVLVQESPTATFSGGDEDGGDLMAGHPCLCFGWKSQTVRGDEDGGTFSASPGYSAGFLGGDEDGGTFSASPGYSAGFLGGDEDGGTFETDFTPPASAPSFVLATRTGWDVSGTLTLDVPATVADGDLLLGAIAVVGESSAWTWPAGWTLLQESSAWGGSGEYSVYYRTWSSGDSMTADVDYTSSQAIGGITAVRSASLPATGAGGFGTGTTADPGVFAVPVDPSTVLVWVVTAGGSTHNDPPSGFTLAPDTTAGEPVVEFYADDQPSGFTGSLASDVDADDWVAFALSVS